MWWDQGVSATTSNGQWAITSAHKQGGNICFGDGHVEFMRSDVANRGFPGDTTYTAVMNP